MRDAVSSPEEEFSAALLRYLNENQSDYVDDKRIARTYGHQLQAENDSAFVDDLVGRIGDLTGKHVLEIGSGSGWRSVALARRGFAMTGLELLASGVAVAELRKRRYHDLPASFEQGEAENLPFADNRFDAVLSFQVIEHVRDVDQTLREMFRVLRPGGFVYMETGNSLYPREEHYRIFWPPFLPKPLGKLYARARGKNPIHLDHVHFMYRPTILRRMRRAGFVATRDLYIDFVRDRCRNYEAIESPAVRRAFEAASVIRLNELVGSAIAGIGLYPGLFLWGEKPAEEPEVCT